MELGYHGDTSQECSPQHESDLKTCARRTGQREEEERTIDRSINGCQDKKKAYGTLPDALNRGVGSGKNKRLYLERRLQKEA